MFKAANNFDVYDPDTGQVILECREDIGFFTKLFRYTDYKRMTPFNIEIKTPDGKPVVKITRGISLFLSKVDVFDHENRYIGGFKQKLFSIGGAFKVLNDQGTPMCQLKGSWTSWNFRFMADDVELANVTKKWSGVGKELFTSADNYVLQMSEDVPKDSPLRQLIIAAVMCIDMVLKE